MTSYMFEKAAKNAVLKAVSSYDIESLTLQDLQFAWFSYTLGNMKCTIYSTKLGRKYAEVTYNKEKDEMYIDIYEKIQNMKIPASQFDFSVDTSK